MPPFRKQRERWIQPVTSIPASAESPTQTKRLGSGERATRGHSSAALDFDLAVPNCSALCGIYSNGPQLQQFPTKTSNRSHLASATALLRAIAKGEVVKLSAPLVRFSTWVFLLTAFAVFGPLAVAADVSVSAPANGAVVSSPFVLQATSATCLSQSTVSMAYSIDSGSDTVFNPATSINTSVSASQGTHTLRVKSWGNGTFCEKDVAITVGTGVAVSSPVNGSTVPSTFLLHATASTCGGQSTSSMAYSFDSNTDNVINAQSINQNVSTSAGGHLLRVKAWGNAGAFCETDLNINVSSQSVVISTPANNSTVPMTFQLQAQAPTCNGRSTSSMTYNFAGHPDAPASAVQSISTQVTAPTTGVQQLNVKAWNGIGDLCETSVSIDAENTASDITISQPTDPNVSMSFPLQASSTSCQGIRTNSMTYSFDHLTDAPAVAAQSISTTATAPGTGSHVLHVKAWNTSGGICVQDMNLDVIDNGIVWPANAGNFGHIEEDNAYAGGVSGESAPGAYQAATDNNDSNPCDKGVAVPPDQTDNLWLTQRDCGTNGAKTGMTTPLTPGPGAPPTNTAAREYEVTSATGSSGVTPGIRWSTRLTGQPSTYQNFGFDAYVYFENDGSLDRTGRLELDINQAVFNQATNQYDLYIMSHQCNFDTGFWEVGGWQATGQRCGDQNNTRSGFSPGIWHHIQIKAHRVNNEIVFDQVALDNNLQNFTCGGGGVGSCTRPVISNAGWQPDGLVVPNFQIDAHLTNGAISSPIKVYVDSFYIYYW
jgi:hypothetical protein